VVIVYVQAKQRSSVVVHRRGVDMKTLAEILSRRRTTGGGGDAHPVETSGFAFRRNRVEIHGVSCQRGSSTLVTAVTLSHNKMVMFILVEVDLR